MSRRWPSLIGIVRPTNNGSASGYTQTFGGSNPQSIAGTGSWSFHDYYFDSAISFGGITVSGVNLNVDSAAAITTTSPITVDVANFNNSGRFSLSSPLVYARNGGTFTNNGVVTGTVSIQTPDYAYINAYGTFNALPEVADGENKWDGSIYSSPADQTLANCLRDSML